MLSISRRCALPVSLLVWAAHAHGQAPPTMIRDLNTSPTVIPSSSPEAGLVFNGWTYFAAERRDVGRELFRTGASAGTTELFADLVPGPLDSWPRELTAFGGRLWFATVANTSLWASDGTAAGTVRVKSFQQIGELAVLGSTLYFAAAGSGLDVELWKTDGTAAGTVQVADINLGGSSDPMHLTPFGGHVYFAANDGIHGRELWRSDGTAAGTVMVRDIQAVPSSASSSPETFAVLGSRIYFFAADGLGKELWGSDGTEAGTQMVSDIRSGPSGSVQAGSDLVVAGGELFLVANDGVHGSELWASDGSMTGTRLVRDVWEGIGRGAQMLTVMGTTVYFQGIDAATGVELWRSDGTTVGTRLVRDLNPGPASSLNQGIWSENCVLGSRLFFSANDGQTGFELWMTDGVTMIGLADLAPGVKSSFPSSPTLDPTASRLFFAANDGALGIELYASDGTPGGTGLWDDIDPTGPETKGSDPHGLVDAFGRLFFVATDPSEVIPVGGHVVGHTPWVSDGTALGTTPIAPLSMLLTSPTAATSTAVGLDGTWLFGAYSPSLVGERPWRSDGTAAGTTLIAFGPGQTASRPHEFALVGSGAMFVAQSKLWYTDGFLGEPVASPGGIYPYYLDQLDGLLLALTTGSSYFFKEGGLWHSNGTVAGTARLVNFSYEIPRSLVVAERQAFFEFFLGDLWTTNGTQAGTQQLTFGNHRPAELAAVRASVFFSAGQSATGRELWVSDGTPAGTRLVADIVAGSASSSPQSLVAFRGGVLFSADTPAFGRELWFSNGTAAGTVLVADIVPGPGSSSPADITAIGSRRAMFSADDGVAGREPWITDGSAAGTMLLGDLNPSGDSHPREMTLSGGRVVFAADDGVHGREPWIYDPGATAQRVGLGCAVPGGLRPVLESGDPVLGAPVEVTARILAPGAFNALLLGAPRAGIHWSRDCFVFLEPGTIAVVTTAVTGASWSVTLPLPPVPALSGVRVGLQLASNVPSGWTELTNSVVWTLGVR